MTVLSGKGAIVTGGSRGIGRAIVERLAADGAAVVFSYARNESAAEEVVAAVAAAGGVAHAVAADFTEADAAGRLLDSAAELLDGLDVLVNNAVLPIRSRRLAEVTDAEFEAGLAANVKAPLATMRYAARHMRDDGRIVNISTLNTVYAFPGLGVYQSGKGALEQLTFVAAVELGERGITANVVSPGATYADPLRRGKTVEDVRALEERTPLGRLGKPADVADVVGMLTGPDARWITAQNIRATGGLL